MSLVSYSVVLRSGSTDVAAVTSGAPDLVPLDVVLCDSRRVSMLNAGDIGRLVFSSVVDNTLDCALELSEEEQHCHYKRGRLYLQRINWSSMDCLSIRVIATPRCP